MNNRPRSINSIQEAKNWLASLHSTGELFHPEDSAESIINSKGNNLFNPSEFALINKLRKELYSFEGFDPCEYILELEDEREYLVRDLSGRGARVKHSGKEIRVLWASLISEEKELFNNEDEKENTLEYFLLYSEEGETIRIDATEFERIN